MKLIGKRIIENGIKNTSKLKTRDTIRGVIISDGKVLMLYSGLFNDYTFPGGGLKSDENHEEALKREMKEEIGANTVNIIKPIGYTEEVRYGISGSDSIYLQKSYYYLIEVSNILEPVFVGREKEQELESKYVEIDETIKHNEKVNKEREKTDNKGYQTVLIRENMVLEYIKNNYIVIK